MSDSLHRQTLKALEILDFTGRGEAYVEQKFLTPLLECLGYETHRDYEVLRHGDDGAAFRLHYPPVEHGATRVKTYNPDYVPTIRKRMFWVIEAKSPKDVAFPFETKYLVQGLQYCIHPEIQAKYLLVTNGSDSAVYDAHGAVFLGQDIYQPILHFKSSELTARWPEIYALLSVDRLRDRIELSLKAMYDKLCLSSLDQTYPSQLLRRIGAAVGEHVKQIEKSVRELFLEGITGPLEIRRKLMEEADPALIFQIMDVPLRTMHSEGFHFVHRSLANGVAARELFAQLTTGFDTWTIFRKEQAFHGLCFLYIRSDDEAVKKACMTFFKLHHDGELPLLTQLECAALRLRRKTLILYQYPQIRAQIAEEIKVLPEIIRFAQTPTALSRTYMGEIDFHDHFFLRIRLLPETELKHWLDQILADEAKIQEEFLRVRAALPLAERDFGGFETYGEGGKHWRFDGLLRDFSIELTADIPV